MAFSSLPAQSGNVLFLILIAVALFAALSYAVTSSSRSGNSTSISKDKARANAAQILQFTTNVKNTLMRLKLSQGCKDTTFDFSNSAYKRWNDLTLNSANPNAPASCKLFDPAGGNVAAVIPSSSALDFVGASATMNVNARPGHAHFRIAQITGVGTDGSAGTESANDIYFIVNWPNRDTCLALNNLLQVINPSGEPPLPTISGPGAEYIDGSLASSRIFSGPEINGNPAFCFKDGDSYAFLHVVVER